MSDLDEDVSPIVLDIGSSVTRAGFAGDDAPVCVMPTIVGHPRKEYYKTSNLCFSDARVGSDAQSHRGVLSLNYPVDRGVITNWEDMQTIFHHLFSNELKIKNEEHPMLLTEPPLNPKHNKERLAQVFFELYGVPAFYVSNQGLLSCYASGRGSALMLEVGDSITHIVPVFEGHCPLSAIRRLDFGGKDLTTYLQSLLHKNGHDFVTTAELEIVRKMKEEVCYVAADFKQELTNFDCTPAMDKTYELPDGNVITMAKERIQCTERLFESVPDVGSKGIHKLLHESIMEMNIDIRKHYNCNVVLSGGTTLFSGFEERLKKEFSCLLPKSCNKIVKIVSPPERKFSVWIGGSILASLSTFQSSWITRQQYEEYGPTIVNRKCY